MESFVQGWIFHHHGVLSDTQSQLQQTLGDNWALHLTKESKANELLKVSFADVLLSFPNNLYLYWFTAVSSPPSTSKKRFNSWTFHIDINTLQLWTLMEYVCVGRKIAYRSNLPFGTLHADLKRASNMDSMDGYNAKLETLHLMVAVLIVTSILFTTYI